MMSHNHQHDVKNYNQAFAVGILLNVVYVLDARDQPAVREILRSTRAGGYRFADLIAAIVKSVPFQMRETPRMKS
jgi:cobalt-zinc-cadmium efflux system protein